MSRVIRPESAARHRSRLLAQISRALRAAAAEPLALSEQRDVVAFIVLALREAWSSAEATATAWERRKYWLKADRFRRDWTWIPPVEQRLTQALVEDDLTGAASLAAGLIDHLAGVRPSARPPRQKPWTGAWDHLQQVLGNGPG